MRYVIISTIIPKMKTAPNIHQTLNIAAMKKAMGTMRTYINKGMAVFIS
jgi:hypothetical protein